MSITRFRCAVSGVFTALCGVLLALSSANAQTDAVAPSTVTAETFVTGWQSQCVSQLRSGPAACHVEQAIHLTENNQQLARVRVQTAEETSSPSLVLHLPFGIYLPYGLDVQFDEGSTRKHNIDMCDPNGCFVFIDTSDKMVGAMKGGQQIKLRFQNMDRANVDITLPLSGFTAAMSGIE